MVSNRKEDWPRDTVLELKNGHELLGHKPGQCAKIHSYMFYGDMPYLYVNWLREDGTWKCDHKTWHTQRFNIITNHR